MRSGRKSLVILSKLSPGKGKNWNTGKDFSREKKAIPLLLYHDVVLFLSNTSKSFFLDESIVMPKVNTLILMVIFHERDIFAMVLWSILKKKILMRAKSVFLIPLWYKSESTTQEVKSFEPDLRLGL